ncbi:hypothetical protein VM1G_09077 [Cytospora mali]|uniref:Uncharacterized protein n=1 Tax=Cytospora mali TaxID=578113 RepID=A0A194WB95_CYTMA|nr:hypothetical protein VM1G_09077 [Valsa mali]
MSERQTDPDCAEPTTVLNKQGTTTDQAAHPIGGHNALEAGSSRELHVAPGIVDLKHTDVDATWQKSRLPGLFGLYWDCASKACLRLQVCINIEADSSLGHRLNIYLFIPPERIQQLNVVPGSKLFGPNTETLDFILSSPPFLVVPNQADW